MSTKDDTNNTPWIPYEGQTLFGLKYAILRAYVQLRWTVAALLHPTLVVSPFSLTVGEALILLLICCALAGGFATGGVGGTGSLCGLLIVGTYATAAHHSPINFLLGIPFERRVFYHKCFALAGTLMGCWHAVEYYRTKDEEEVTIKIVNGVAALVVETEDESGAETSGWVALGAFLLIPVLSLPVLRRRLFEVFYYAHWVLFLVGGVGSVMHGAGTVAFGLALWGVDVLVRLIFEQLFCRRPRTALFKVLPGNVVRISFPRNDFQYKGGQYVFVAVPDLSYLEWHPISISSAPHDEFVSLHIRALGNWSQSLYDTVKARQSDTSAGVPMRFCFEGAYGEPSVDIESRKYEHFCLVSAGIGITPMQSISNELLDCHRRGRPLQRLWFLWTVRDRLLEIVDTTRDGKMQYKDNRLDLPMAFQPNLLSAEVADTQQGPAKASPLFAQYFLTGEAALSDTEAGRAGTHKHVHLGRPDLSQQLVNLKECIRGEQHHQRINVAVLFCGPPKMGEDLHRACKDITDGTVQFDFHSEVFAF